MATYYLDPAAGGSDDGTDWTNAWTTLQRAIDGTDGTQPAAGDTCLCRGTEIVSTQIEWDGASGNVTSGYIKFTGVNSSGVEDGTKFELDGNGGSMNIIRINVPDFVMVSNFEIHNNTNAGIAIQGYSHSDFWIFNNCHLHNCDDGFDGGGNGMQKAYFYRLLVEDMTRHGFFRCGGVWNSCVVKDCADTGIKASEAIEQCIILNTVVHSCSTRNIFMDYYNGVGFQVAHGIVTDGAGGDGVTTDNPFPAVMSACRITENVTGINSQSVAICSNCYLPAPSGARDNTTQTSGLIEQLTIDGTDTNDFAGADADGGYEDPTGFNFNLASDATMRAVEVPMASGHQVYLSAGLEPAEPVGDGPAASGVACGWYAFAG
jgi:hypothetical protein